MKVIFLHPPLYPVNHEFFELLGENIELIIYNFGEYPRMHSTWSSSHFQREAKNYKMKIFGKGAVLMKTQSNPIIIRHLLNEKPDIVISIAFWLPSLYSAILKHVIGYKFLVLTNAIHETEKNLSFLKQQMRKIICSNSNALISASDLTTKYLKQFAPKLKIFQSYQTINTKSWIKDFEILPNKKKLRKELNLPDDKIILLGVGNFIYKKNWESVFQNIGRLENVFFALIGSGELEKQYKKLINKTDLQDKVRIVGRKEGVELKMYFKASDILIFPSLYDQFGFVVLEALSAGLPVVCSKYSGASSLIHNKYTGYVIDPNDDYFKQIKNTIKHLDKMQKNAKNSAIDLTLEGRVEEFKNIFNSVMKK